MTYRLESAIDTYRKIITKMMEKAKTIEQKKRIFLAEFKSAISNGNFGQLWTYEEICALANEIKNKYNI
jgi:hypothetical protein